MVKSINNKSLKWRALQGGGVVAASHVLSQVIRLGGNLILTRILAPEMFGIMAIATVVIVGVAMLSDIGVRQYVIKCSDVELSEALDAAWTLQIARGVVLAVVVLLIAAFLKYLQFQGVAVEGTVYGNQDLPLILAFFSLIPLLGGLQSTKQFVLSRKIKVLRLQVLGLANQLIGISITLFFAIYLRNIWALVLGTVAGSFLSALFSHAFIPGRGHKLSFDAKKTREIVNFTKWIFLSSILGFVTNNSDKLWFGIFMTPSQLGVYTIGFNLVYVFNAIFEKLAASIILPSLCEVDREKPDKLVDVYYRIRRAIDPIIMFGAGVMFSLGPYLVSILYDDRYALAGTVIRILSVSIISICFLLGKRYLVSRGLLKDRAWVTFAEAISINICILLLYSYFGVIGAFYGVALSPFIPVILLFIILRKHKMLSLVKELRFIPLVVPGLAVGVIVEKIMVNIF